MLIALSPSTVSANAGIPTIIYTFPLLVVLMIPLVVGESFLIAFLLKAPTKKVWAEVTFANIASTLCGAPLMWVVLFIMQILTDDGKGQRYDTLKDNLLAGTLHTAVIDEMTGSEPGWAYPAVFAFQFFAYGVASLLIEYVVLRLVWRKNPKQHLFKAVLVANVASYTIIMAIPLLLVTREILYG
jgi:hypothetical protein